MTVTPSQPNSHAHGSPMPETETKTSLLVLCRRPGRRDTLGLFVVPATAFRQAASDGAICGPSTLCWGAQLASRTRSAAHLVAVPIGLAEIFIPQLMDPC